MAKRLTCSKCGNEYWGDENHKKYDDFNFCPDCSKENNSDYFAYDGWGDLKITGTMRQVKWAMDIRKKEYRKFEKGTSKFTLKDFQENGSAKFWIENR